MEKLYCISGLGADKRAFSKLSVQGMELVHLDWPPHEKHDTVSSYATKVSALIPGDKPYILGLSFGGMIAVEIAKQRPTEKVFLVSSAKKASELPLISEVLKLVIKSGIIPAGLLTIPNTFLYDHFGAKTPDEKKMLGDIIRDTDGRFMKWAFKALLSWDNDTDPGNVIHIHGTADKIIPPTLVKADYWIDGGSHIMIYNRAGEINELIAKNL